MQQYLLSEAGLILMLLKASVGGVGDEAQQFC